MMQSEKNKMRIIVIQRGNLSFSAWTSNFHENDIQNLIKS